MHATFYVLLAVAYALGSLSSAVLVCKAFKLPDPRREGSNNPGATNVLRLGNKTAAALVLLGDVLKGVIPILLCHFFGLYGMAMSFVGFAAIIGHMFPVFFGFKGGKGVATAIGVILALSLKMALVVILVWLIVITITRYVSLASMVAAASAPVLTLWLADPHCFIGLVFISLLIIARHYSNIGRLLNGEESKLGKKKT